MRIQGQFYRAHDPKWAFEPLSGKGAALKGGRFNPVGVQALYLGSSIEGVVAEISHGLSLRMQPLLLVAYQVDCCDICDLTSPDSRARQSVDEQEMSSDWFADSRSGHYPVSWALYDRLRGKGFAGLLVPSFAFNVRAEHRNLVLWEWGTELPHKVQFIDDSNRLPKDQSSWS